MPGILCTIESGTPERSLSRRLADAAGGLALYAALWGAVLNMAGYGVETLWPLLPGGALAAVLSLLPRRGRTAAAAAAGGVALGAVLAAVCPEEFLNGGKLLLNRLFEASEARQAYIYEMFPLSGDGGVGYALLPLGILIGLLCACKVGRVAAFLLLCGGCAWLGVTPAMGWLTFLAAALGLSLLSLPGRGGGAVAAAGGALALLMAVCAATVMLFPGEDAGLAAWADKARDRLAVRTEIYLENWAPPETPSEAPTPTPPPEAPEGGGFTLQTPEIFELLRRPGWVTVLVILLFALALFVPSVYSDRLKKRRARNRAGLEDADPAAAIRSALPYALRWLVLGGLTAENVPLGAYAGQIGERYSPALRAEFEAVLPLWQEAVYSDHPMSEEQRGRVQDFTRRARDAAREKMGRKEKLLAEYVYAL